MQYLIHVANLLYLGSYLVKDILVLRALTILGGIFLMTFYVLSVPVALPPLAWSAVFMVINAYQIYLLVLERRPVRLKDDELKLYQLAFRSLTPREFVKLLALGSWRDAEREAHIVEKGVALEHMMVIASGRTAVSVAGKPVAHLKEGQFIGEMSFITGERPSADVVAEEPTRYVAWPKLELKKFLAENPPLRATMQLLIGADLVTKLRAA